MKAPLNIHPAATLFPLMSDADLRALADDIKAHGQHEPVVLLGGSVLDGRNRLLACESAGVEPRLEDAPPEAAADPLGWVLSKNLHRRHLTEAQRAMVGARLKEQFEEAARARQTANLHQGAAVPVAANLRQRETESGRASEKAAAALNVSPRSVETAARVRRDAVTDLADAVDRGDVAVSAAAEVARLPAAEQRALVAEGPKAVKDRAREVREERRPVPPRAVPPPPPVDPFAAERAATEKAERDEAEREASEAAIAAKDAEADGAPLTDDRGRPVPASRAADWRWTKAKFTPLLDRIDSALAEVAQAKATYTRIYSALRTEGHEGRADPALFERIPGDLTRADGMLTGLRDRVARQTPGALHDPCAGRGCDGCWGFGWYAEQRS